MLLMLGCYRIKPCLRARSQRRASGKLALWVYRLVELLAGGRRLTRPPHVGGDANLSSREVGVVFLPWHVARYGVDGDAHLSARRVGIVFGPF